MATRTLCKIHAHNTGYFINNKIQSDGLGGFLGVSQTMKLGAEKRIFRRKFRLLFICLLISQVNNPPDYEFSCLIKYDYRNATKQRDLQKYQAKATLLYENKPTHNQPKIHQIKYLYSIK